MSRGFHDHLLFRARLRPTALAVYGPGGPVAYRELVYQVDALATELSERGLGRQDMVAIQLGISYLHLLLILALDRLGIPSTSLPSDAPTPSAVSRDLGATAIISGTAAPAELPCRWIEMPDSPRPKLGKPDAGRLAALDSSADGLVRVSWSSGTMGGAKGSPILRRIQAARLTARQTARGLGPHVRYFTGVPFSSAPGYIMPLATLAAGGAVILPSSAEDFVSLANALGVTMTSASPAMLADLVRQRRERPGRLETVDVSMVSGTHLPSQLAHEARLTLTPNLWIGYGATETDGVANAELTVAMADPNAAGFLFPWVDAQIVDAADRPLPAGTEGLLRLRCAQMIEGYWRDTAASARNFRDGWFYPGDLAVITPERLLRITGRVEDVIVRDGTTVSPTPLEEAIRTLPGVRDVAVFPWTGTGGAPQVGAALVLEPGTDPEAVRAAAQRRLGDLTPAAFFLIERLPRNESGKVVRRELVALAQRSVRR